jgi:hypothetical protein
MKKFRLKTKMEVATKSFCDYESRFFDIKGNKRFEVKINTLRRKGSRYKSIKKYRL